ncbi:MAG: DUF3232 domain-containing protein [Oscillospiraceae bacterium]|nr:DUF3232 domain-containing protein [Oscillospiraceae bacterium]
MTHTLSKDNLAELFKAVKNEPMALGMITKCMDSFGQYHKAIFEMETWLKLYNYDNMSREDYQDKMKELDNRRTTCHNSVLDSVNILNRIAAKYSIPIIYEGEVSREQPYRREVANAVLAYVEGIILERR